MMDISLEALSAAVKNVDVIVHMDQMMTIIRAFPDTLEGRSRAMDYIIATALEKSAHKEMASDVICGNRPVKSCLGMAYDWIKPRYHGALQNPVNDVKLPKGMRAEKRHAPTDNETQRILDGIDSYFGFFYYMLVYTGMRRGELLGLTWDDLDLDAATITIVKQVVYTSNKPIVTPLKTESSMRTIPILPPLLAELKARRPDDWKGQYIFSAPADPTKPMGESTLRRKEMHYCKEHGFVNITEIPRVSRTGAHYTHKKYTMTITPHMLRHCTATLCYEAGVDSRTAAALLGHSDPRITEAIYTELRQQHKQMELEKLVTYVDKKYGQDQTEHSDSTM